MDKTRVRVDPFLLGFLESVELELARAMELHHRRWDVTLGPDVPASSGDGESIATLQRTVDALQAALERPESAILH